MLIALKISPDLLCCSGRYAASEVPKIGQDRREFRDAVLTPEAAIAYRRADLNNGGRWFRPSTTHRLHPLAFT
jgi:hypothetical protein